MGSAVPRITALPPIQGKIWSTDKKAEILNNGNKYKAIPERDLETYLNKG